MYFSTVYDISPRTDQMYIITVATDPFYPLHSSYKWSWENSFDLTFKISSFPSILWFVSWLGMMPRFIETQKYD